jgi:hypothetical protein
MTLPPLSSLPQSRLKVPLEEEEVVVGQDQADQQSPINLHISQVVLDQDRNCPASEGQKTWTSSLEMRRSRQVPDLDMAYTTPSDMGRWKIGITWKDSGRIPSSNTYGSSPKTTTSFLPNQYVCP